MRNFTYLQLAVGTIIARMLVSYIFLKPYYQHNVYSIYEYLTTRFGTRDQERRVRRVPGHAHAGVRVAHLRGGDHAGAGCTRCGSGVAARTPSADALDLRARQRRRSRC